MRSDIVSVLPVPAPARTTTSASASACTTLVLRKVHLAGVVGCCERRPDRSRQLVRHCWPSTTHWEHPAASGTTAHSSIRASMNAWSSVGSRRGPPRSVGHEEDPDAVVHEGEQVVDVHALQARPGAPSSAAGGVPRGSGAARRARPLAPRRASARVRRRGALRAGRARQLRRRGLAAPELTLDRLEATRLQCVAPPSSGSSACLAAARSTPGPSTTSIASTGQAHAATVRPLAARRSPGGPRPSSCVHRCATSGREPRRSAVRTGRSTLSSGRAR